jgi:hypothetical protein
VKRRSLSVSNGTITHVLANSEHHVAVLVAVIYFALRGRGRLSVGDPVGVVATLVLAAELIGR